MSDPKAIPDVLHVDGPTRERPDFMDWLEAWLNGYNAAQRGVPNDEGIVAVAREGFENGGAERAKRLMAAFEARFPVSAEPSPNPLREALETIASGKTPDGKVPDWEFAAFAEDRERQIKEFAREALATDQSRSDRTSDEATPAEPVYEWRICGARDGYGVWQGPPRPDRNDNELHSLRKRNDEVWVERRVPAGKPGPWERVDDGGRRDG